MLRVYLSTAPSELSGKDAYGAQISLKALITRIAAVSANPLGDCLPETVELLGFALLVNTSMVFSDRACADPFSSPN